MHKSARVFFTFFFFQGVGMGEEDAFGELFSISSENREKNSVIPSAG